MNKNRFGQILRLARRNARKTLEELATIIGISPTYLSKIERGLCPPFREHKIVAAAEFLGIAPEALLRASSIARDEMTIVRPQTVEAYAFLLRRLNSLDEDELGEVYAILRRSAIGGEATTSDAVADDRIISFNRHEESGAQGAPRSEKESRYGDATGIDVVDATYGRAGHARGRSAGTRTLGGIPTDRK